MTTQIRAPIIQNAGVRLTVGRSFKRAGDPMTLGEPLVEIDTDSLTHEVPAPVTGVLSVILLKDGASVETGALLGTIQQF